MDRELYRFRSKARIVAFVDLILSSMSLCLCLILFIGLLRMTSMVGGRSMEVEEMSKKFSVNMDLEDNKPEMDMDTLKKPSMFVPNKAFVNLMWLFLALISIMTAIQILAAVRLLNATQIGKDPAGSMKLCRFWRRVCMFFTGLLIFNFFSSFRQRGDNFFEVSFLLTSILIRVVALYVVQQFVSELDVALTSGSLPIHRNQPHPHVHPQIPPIHGGDNIAYGFDNPPPYPMPMPSPAYVPPPKYEDVVKEPYKFNEA